MLKELKFVQGAVAKKDFLPAMTHFVIADGKVRSYNGMIALCSPIAFDIACKPKAVQLVKAIANCTTTVTLSLTPAGKLRVASGTFKALVECVQEETAHVEPEGEYITNFDGEALLQAFKVLHPFIGNDASRIWTNGILIKGQSAYATNNVTAVEYWIGVNMPFVVNIPSDAVKEMLRIGEVPISAQLTETSISFHYNDGKWIRTQLFENTWPDLEKIFNKPSNPVILTEELFVALENLKSFTDKAGRIYINGDTLSTASESDEEAGASYEITGFNVTGIYQLDMLKLLKGCVDRIDWSLYPAPALFFGERLRGAIIGMKL